MERRRQLQEQPSSFNQYDSFQQEIFKQVESADLTEALIDESNIHEIPMNKVFNNMSSAEKKELKLKAAEEVIADIQISQDDPEYERVFCQKMDEWMARWSAEKEAVVDNYLEKFRKSREVDTFDVHNLNTN